MAVREALLIFRWYLWNHVGIVFCIKCDPSALWCAQFGVNFSRRRSSSCCFVSDARKSRCVRQVEMRNKCKRRPTRSRDTCLIEGNERELLSSITDIYPYTLVCVLVVCEQVSHIIPSWRCLVYSLGLGLSSLLSFIYAPTSTSHITHKFFYLPSRRIYILCHTVSRHAELCWRTVSTKLLYIHRYRCPIPYRLVLLVFFAYDSVLGESQLIFPEQI